jgi:hypothetical protein
MLKEATDRIMAAYTWVLISFTRWLSDNTLSITLIQLPFIGLPQSDGLFGTPALFLIIINRID